MLGTEGIAVGMSCRILPHNFPELLEAQIAILKKQPFKCLPDFQTGGLMDARDYRTAPARSKSAPKSRSRTNPRSSSRKSRRPRPPIHLIGSIEDAARKGKIKVKSVNDFTSEEVEIEIKAPSGVSAEKLVDALYAFTDCEVTIASRIIVIKDNRPVEMTVSEVLRENTDTARRNSQARTGTEGKQTCRTNCISARSNAFSSRNAFTKKSSNAKRTKRCWPRFMTVSSRSANRCFAT